MRTRGRGKTASVGCLNVGTQAPPPAVHVQAGDSETSGSFCYPGSAEGVVVFLVRQYCTFTFRNLFPSARWWDHFFQKRETAHSGMEASQAFVFSSVKGSHNGKPRTGSGAGPLGFLVVRGKESAYQSRDAGSIPRPGRSHRPRSNKAAAPTTPEPSSRSPGSQLLKGLRPEPVLHNKENPHTHRS